MSFETLVERATSESIDIQIDHQQRAGASRLEECFIEMALQKKKKNAFQFRV